MNELQNEIYAAATAAITELIDCDRPFFNPVKLLVVGGSSSEMAGGVIGHQSTFELGEALAQAALDLAEARGFACASPPRPAAMRSSAPCPGPRRAAHWPPRPIAGCAIPCWWSASPRTRALTWV